MTKRLGLILAIIVLTAFVWVIATKKDTPHANSRPKAVNSANKQGEEKPLAGKGPLRLTSPTASELLQGVTLSMFLADRNATLRIVADRMTQLSLQELEDLIAERKAVTGNDPKDGFIVAAALGEIGKRDLGLAFKLIGTLDPEAQKHIATLSYPELAKTDSEQFSQWLKNQHPGEWRRLPSTLVAGLKALAAVSSEKAAIFIASSPPTADKTMLFVEVANQLGESNFQEAEKWFEICPEEIRGDVIGNALTTFAQKQPREAFDKLIKLKGDSIRPMYVRLMAGEWLNRAPAEAMKAFQEMPERMLVVVLEGREISEAMVRRDSDIVLDLLSRITPTKSNERVFVQNLGSLINKEPDKVMSWLDQQNKEGGAQRLAGQVFSIWAAQNPSAAQSALSQRPELLVNEAVIGGLARGFGQNNVQTAITWSEQLPEQQRSAFIQSALEVGVERQAHRIAEILNQNPTWATPGIYGKTAASLAGSDFDFAKEWALKQSAANQPSAVAGLIQGWVKSDAQGASKWLAELPDGPARVAGIEVLVEEIHETDPQAAAEWRKLLPQAGD